MEDAHAGGAGDVNQAALVAARHIGASPAFARLVVCQRSLAHDAPRQTDGIGGHALVTLSGEVVHPNGRRCCRVFASQAHFATAAGPKVVDDHREAGEAVKLGLKTVSGKGQHVEAQVCALNFRRRAGEQADLARRHGERAAPRQRELRRHARFGQVRMHVGVERVSVADLIPHANLKVILQVDADAGAVCHHRDAVASQMGRRTNAGAHQNLRRTQGACCQDHFFAGACRDGDATLLPNDAHGLAAFYQHAIHQRMGLHHQVGAVPDRLQERIGSAPAAAVFLIDVDGADAEVVARVEVLCGCNASLHGAGLHGV